MAVDENTSSLQAICRTIWKPSLALAQEWRRLYPISGFIAWPDLAELYSGELFKALRVWAFSASTLKSKTGLVRPSKSWLSGK